MSRAGDSEQLEVRIESLSLPDTSGASRQVLGKIAFSLGSGEIAALVGPSGCGKTTLLRTIAGLLHARDGSVVLPKRARLGVVFQEPRLLPWRDVETNVRLAAPDCSDDERHALFSALGLSEHRGDFPASLSLGLARRVAIARAFAVRPAILLLDEPFVSLDAALALRLRQELIALIEAQRVTTLLVTHNVDEAIAIADKVLILSARPARLLAQMPIAIPRAQRNDGALARLRAELLPHLDEH